MALGFKSRQIVSSTAALRQQLEELDPAERFAAARYAVNEIRHLMARDRPGVRGELERLLALHDGNVSAVARAMGKERIQIRRWCRASGIDISDYRR